MASDTAQAPDELMTQPTEHLTRRQVLWLKSLSLPAKLSQATLFHVNRLAMRWLFGLRVDGTEHIPTSGPYILAPNHTSSLDPCVIAAALTLRQFRTVRWAARKGVVTGNSIREFVARISRVLPIRRSIGSLAAASAVLDDGENLVWFPEGTRSEDGDLQPLKSGIGHLATHHCVAVVPVIISGAHKAMPPPGRRLRSLARISVRFGKPIHPNSTSQDIFFPEKFVVKLEAEMRVLSVRCERRP